MLLLLDLEDVEKKVHTLVGWVFFFLEDLFFIDFSIEFL